MKFTNFEVTRIGTHMVVSCSVDTPGPGKTIQISVDCAGGSEGDLYEHLFRRLAHCASVYEDVSDDALAATVQLMKGKTS